MYKFLSRYSALSIFILINILLLLSAAISNVFVDQSQLSDSIFAYSILLEIFAIPCVLGIKVLLNYLFLTVFIYFLSSQKNLEEVSPGKLFKILIIAELSITLGDLIHTIVFWINDNKIGDVA